jgi:hypothetical protein
MCNCNQQRALYAANNTGPKGTVKVISIAEASTVINGDITGRMYVFRNKNDFNWVDKRDAISMKENKSLQVLM